MQHTISNSEIVSERLGSVLYLVPLVWLVKGEAGKEVAEAGRGEEGAGYGAAHRGVRGGVRGRDAGCEGVRGRPWSVLAVSDSRSFVKPD